MKSVKEPEVEPGKEPEVEPGKEPEVEPGKEPLKDVKSEVVSEEDLNKLMDLVVKNKVLNGKMAADLLKISEKDVEKLADKLQQKSMVKLHSKFFGGFDIVLSPDALKKMKQEEEKKKVALVKEELKKLRRESGMKE